MVPRTSRHSVVATSSGGLAFSVSVRDHVVSTDQPGRAGGDDSAPTPLELLSVSLASCIALYVHKFCETNSLVSNGLAVEVKPLWKEEPGRFARFDVILHVPDTIPALQYTAIEEVAMTCPVHNTLTHTPEIAVRLQELVSTAGATAVE